MLHSSIERFAKRGSGVEIYNDGPNGRYVVSSSRNLRGIADYSRRPGQQVVRVIAERDAESGSMLRGRLIVHFADGAACVAFFASHTVMLDWVYRRRKWRMNRVELSIEGKVRGAL